MRCLVALCAFVLAPLEGEGPDIASYHGRILSYTLSIVEFI